MSGKIVTDEKGTEYEVQPDGTLKEVTSSSPPMVGPLVDAAINVVKTLAEAPLPKSK